MLDKHKLADSESPHRFNQIGGLFLGTGILLLLARTLEAFDGLPPMPRFWYQNDSLWFLAGLTGVFAGVWLLKDAARVASGPQPWAPSEPGQRFRGLLIYTRNACPLCDEAAELLGAYYRWLPPATVIDVDTDPKLVEQFGTCVPVILLDGKVRFRGRINEVLLRRLIEGTPPQP